MEFRDLGVVWFFGLSWGVSFSRRHLELLVCLKAQGFISFFFPRWLLQSHRAFGNKAVP
ncbi:hypothetical protein ACJX0J_009778, partial [Zea mays]